MKKTLLLLSVLLVLLWGCDRFDHDFAANTSSQSFSTFKTEFKTTMQTAFQNQNLANLLALYSDDYLNNGSTKADMQVSFESIMQQASASLTISVSGDENSFVYTITDGTKSVNQTFTDVAKLVNDKWVLYGNQIIPTVKMPVFIELMTSEFCSNCPLAEHKLHQMQVENEDIIYLEYQWWYANQGALNINNDFVEYYGLSSAPTAIFNGGNLITGTEQTALDTYPTNAGLIAEQDAKLELTNLEVVSIEGLTLTAKVKLNNFGQVGYTNLKLKAAVIDRYMTEFLNYNDEPLYNTVIAKADKAIIEADNNNFITIEVDLSTVHENLLNDGQVLPEDSSLVVWAQTIEPTYNNQTCRVHFATKIDIAQ